jgi:predicted Zn-dependent protease
MQTQPEPDERSTNRLARWMSGEEMPKLTLEQVESYLAANQRRAETLLAAFQASGDKRWLQEAKEKYPNDPSVAFMALSRSDTPDERRQWLDTLKRVAPDNALADYLSANDYLKAGRIDDAVRDLAAANSKLKLQDYWVERVQNAEEATVRPAPPRARPKRWRWRRYSFRNLPSSNNLPWWAWPSRGLLSARWIPLLPLAPAGRR